MFQRVRVVVWVVLLGLAQVAAVRADVLVVGPGEAFTDIQPAIDAAVDHDIVLVKSGEYGPISVVNKSLTIVADSGAIVTVPGQRVEVRNLAPGRSVSLLGLRMTGGSGVGWPGLMLLNNQGSVRVERCEITVAIRLVVWVVSSVDVAFTDCLLLHNELGAGWFAPSTTGVEVIASNASFHGCHVLGGMGHTPQVFGPAIGLPGHPGVLVQNSTVFAAESVFQGGQGGAGTPETVDGWSAASGGSGGPGVRLEGASLLRRRGVTLLGGAGGLGGSGCTIPFVCGGQSGQPGPPGAPIQILGGTDAAIPGAPHSMTMPVPLREQEVFTAGFHGVSGELAAAFLSLSTANVFIYSALGQLLVFPENLLLMGIVPPSGTLEMQDVFTDIPGLEGITGHFQPLFVNGLGQLTLGSPVAVVILDKSF